VTAATETFTTVPTAVGNLRAILRVPHVAVPLPGIVLVDGSGDGSCDDWGEGPAMLSDCGAVILRHDKPGSGTSPGDWREQSFEDRARETLAAVATLRAEPSTSGRPVGLFGVSQGGWVALLAAALDPGAIDFIVSVSGPGVTPAVQDRVRIERELRASGIEPEAVTEALAWIDERERRLRTGEPVADVLADQNRHADRPWYAITTQYFDDLPMLSFLARLVDFDPVAVMPGVRCPVLAMFGGADALVPVRESVLAFAQHLPELPGSPHGIAIFPGADHGLFLGPPQPDVPRREQTAPGFLAMVEGFIAAAAARAA